MSNDLDYLSNLLSADIESEPDNTATSPITAGKRKITEDDTFIKELEANVQAKKRKVEEVQSKQCNDLIKKHFGVISDDEEDEYNIFIGGKDDKKESPFYSMGLSKKTTWKSKVDTTKATEAVNTSQKFDVYAEPIFGMRIINPCLAMQDLKYKMTGRQPIPMHKIKQHVTSPDVDSIDWVIGGVIVGKSPPKTSAKGSQYCIWTLSDLKSGLKTVSLFLFSSAFTSLWKTNVGTVVGVLNPSVMENSKSQDEACLSVNNGDKIMCWGTSKDYGKCKARKKDGENCTNFVNVHDCAYCVYHVKQEYKKFTGRSEFQSQGGGALTNLRNKVLGKNEVFYGGQSFMALKPAKKNPKMLARDNKLLQSLSKTGVVVSALANQDTRKSCSSSMQNQTRGKKIEDAERMRRLSGQPVYVSAYNAADQERNNTVTFKSIFQQSPSSSTSNTKTTPLQSRISPGNVSNKSKNVDSSKPCDVSNKPSKLSDVDDFFDFESNVHLSGSLKTPTSSNKLNKTSSSSPKLNTMSASKLNESNKSSPKGSEASKVPKQDVHSPITRAPKLVQTNTQTNSKAGQRETTSSSNKKDLISQPSQAATDISNYFAKKSASVTTGSSDSSKKIILSKDLRERKKQIARAKAESLIKHKGGIEKADPNSLKKNISKIMNKSVDLELEIEGDKKENDKMAAFKAMMNKTSRHMDLVDEAHRKEEEEYFAKLEKKEQMEEKMLNTFKVECKAVRCVECKYTWFSASELCKKERHTIKVINTFKRFFKCVNCNNRTISFDVVPLRPCRNCNVNNWARAPMMKERKVSMEAQLSIRGGESKYLNSMSSGGEASLNLLVPE